MELTIEGRWSAVGPAAPPLHRLTVGDEDDTQVFVFVQRGKNLISCRSRPIGRVDHLHP
ncbi:hypothetical protein [Streptomyces sp. NPDC047130]|uniref:hypothetical protein n=1 Tax=Streptomyces sp. NPDC047130 TaxID=3155261 RepID=UPI0033CF1968